MPFKAMTLFSGCWKRTHWCSYLQRSLPREEVSWPSRKPAKISTDQSALVVRDKSQDITCSTSTELETTNAMRRRALAFDLVQACNYHVMSSFHAEVFDHLHMVPPPRYFISTFCSNNTLAGGLLVGRVGFFPGSSTSDGGGAPPLPYSWGGG